MASAAPAKTADRKLQLKEVLDWMIEDGVLDAPMAAKLTQDARSRGVSRHPILIVSEARLRAAKAPNASLTAPFVTEWLAGRVRMPFYHIDPLKIDLKNVTQVMSSDYASKRGILPAEVSGSNVTIAVSEPFVTSWEAELGQMLRLNITRVLSNPADIERYQGEFFN